MEQIRISARTLGLLNLPDFCVRCFWIRLHCREKFPFQIPIPGIFISIDTYGKNIIHSYLNSQGTLPPWFPNIGEVQDFLSGSELHHSRFCFKDLETNILLTGTPDDVFRMSDNSYHIIDYKTARVTATQDALFPLYEVQLNVYAYIAKSKGFSPISAASLIYMEPQTAVEPGNFTALMSNDRFRMNFRPMLRPVELREEELVPYLLGQAREIFDRPNPPERTSSCRDCQFVDQLLVTIQGRGN